jgi:hypothetical protein
MMPVVEKNSAPVYLEDPVLPAGAQYLDGP